MEDLSRGQGVTRYVVEGRSGAIEGWRLLAAGESSGHERLHRIEGTRVSTLRLRIETALYEPPAIRRFAVGRVG